MRYFISAIDHDWLERRAEASFCSGPQIEGHLRLFNKNALETNYARIVERCQNRHGWIIEMSHVPRYFRSLLTSEEM